MGDNNTIKQQLYPDGEKEYEACWQEMLAKDELVPAICDVNQIFSLINVLIKHDIEADGKKLEAEQLKRLIKSVEDTKEYIDVNKADNNTKEFFRGIYNTKISKENRSTKIKFAGSIVDVNNIEVDVIKGSIYKIKKYFLENNNLKDIRGGSMMIDHLNGKVVSDIIDEQGFSKNNIIYCGGGNIFIVTPKGYGHELCEKFETEFTKISLTVMSAFETLTCKLYELLFNFSNIKREIEEMVTERSKMKFYEIDPNPEIEPNLYKYDKKLNIQGIDEPVDFEKYYKLYPKVKSGVCDLCHTRDARYEISDEADKPKACHSCLRKHVVGKEKSIFYSGYEKYVREILKVKNFKMNHKDIKSIDEIGSEIAVIYGDGNNMGNVVKNIKNIFEMMYFSRRTDEITKHSVYNAIYNEMKSEARFEVIGLGGDDIFIIVPAKYAFHIASRIIENFDREFNNSITMSVGIAIAKSATPVTSLFALAQQRLKSAKKLVKNDKSINEGTIDVIELIGDMHVSSKNDKIILEELNDNLGKVSYKIAGLEDSNHLRLFPMTKSDFEVCSKKIKYIDSLDSNLRTQLYKIGYAKENMGDEEFQLFYYYQNSKNKSNNKKNHRKYTVHELVNMLNDCCACDKKNSKSEEKLKCSECKFDNPDNRELKCEKTRHKFNNYNPTDIDWNELILMYERETEYNKLKGKE